MDEVSSDLPIPAARVVAKRPGAYSWRYLPPAIPQRNANVFRRKRKRLIGPDVAEIVDFKDIISTSARFQESDKHFIPLLKAPISEKAVAAALQNLEDNKTALDKESSDEENDYHKNLKAFGIDESKSSGRKDKIIKEQRLLWPDSKVKVMSQRDRNKLSGGRLFQDVNSKMHRALLEIIAVYC